MGRPSTYTATVAALICERLENGVQLNEIYALSHPDTGEIRYIGKARDSRKRFGGHLRASSSGKTTPVYQWIRELMRDGKTPKSTVLMLTADWPTSERQIISQYRADGFRLLNVAPGGCEPFCSVEQRAENGKANAKKVHSNPARRRIWEIKQRLGRAYEQGHLSEEIKSKMRLAASKAPGIFGSWAGLR